MAAEFWSSLTEAEFADRGGEVARGLHVLVAHLSDDVAHFEAGLFGGGTVAYHFELRAFEVVFFVIHGGDAEEAGQFGIAEVFPVAVKGGHGDVVILVWLAGDAAVNTNHHTIKIKSFYSKLAFKTWRWSIRYSLQC